MSDDTQPRAAFSKLILNSLAEFTKAHGSQVGLIGLVCFIIAPTIKYFTHEGDYARFALQALLTLCLVPIGISVCKLAFQMIKGWKVELEL